MTAGAGGAMRARGWRATAIPVSVSAVSGLRRAFSLGFQAGEIAVFIPWRGRQPNLAPMARWIMPELEATAPPIPVCCYGVVAGAAGVRDRRRRR